MQGIQIVKLSFSTCSVSILLMFKVILVWFITMN